jgi:6-phosphofructokinase
LNGPKTECRAVSESVYQEAMSNMKVLGIDALVVLGG